MDPRRIPKLLFTLALVAALIYAENTGGSATWIVLIGVIGLVWIGKLCFPIAYRLDQRLRRRQHDQPSDEDH